MMGTIAGTSPLQSDNDLLYTISGTDTDDAKIISHQVCNIMETDCVNRTQLYWLTDNQLSYQRQSRDNIRVLFSITYHKQ